MSQSQEQSEKTNLFSRMGQLLEDGTVAPKSMSSDAKDHARIGENIFQGIMRFISKTVTEHKPTSAELDNLFSGYLDTKVSELLASGQINKWFKFKEEMYKLAASNSGVAQYNGNDHAEPKKSPSAPLSPTNIPRPSNP